MNSNNSKLRAPSQASMIEPQMIPLKNLKSNRSSKNLILTLPNKNNEIESSSPGEHSDVGQTVNNGKNVIEEKTD